MLNRYLGVVELHSAGLWGRHARSIVRHCTCALLMKNGAKPWPGQPGWSRTIMPTILGIFQRATWKFPGPSPLRNSRAEESGWSFCKTSGFFSWKNQSLKYIKPISNIEIFHLGIFRTPVWTASQERSTSLVSCDRDYCCFQATSKSPISFTLVS